MKGARRGGLGASCYASKDFLARLFLQKSTAQFERTPLVEWAGLLFSFPSILSLARGTTSSRNSSYNRRESGTQGFSQTCLLSLTLLSRAAQDICTPPFASILSHERRKNKEKERRRKRDKERGREKTASQGHNPLYTGRRRQGLSAGSRVSSLAASRNSGRKTGPFLGETRTTDTHVSPRKTNFHSCPADLTTRNPENPTEHRLKPLLPRPHGGRDEISTRTDGGEEGASFHRGCESDPGSSACFSNSSSGRDLVRSIFHAVY